MEVALTVAKVLALLAVAALCVYVIAFISRMKQTLGTIEATVKMVSIHLTPVLDNVEVLTSKATIIAGAVEDQIDVVKESVETLKSVTDNIAEFERDIQSRVEGPIRETASVVRAVSRGVKTFFERVRT